MFTLLLADFSDLQKGESKNEIAYFAFCLITWKRFIFMKNEGHFTWFKILQGSF